MVMKLQSMQKSVVAGWVPEVSYFNVMLESVAIYQFYKC